MSEFWVSKKKYYCKYCEIYIADDAPSRQQHENGLRHKGNKERFVRGLYKTSEKRKHDLDEEKREMARVEQAAQAAFAQDVSSGVAKASTSSLPSPHIAPNKTKPSKPASAWSNYSTAESLGITDPDAERAKAEAERRRTQGVAGEWQVVTSSTEIPTEENPSMEYPESELAAGRGQKREAEAPVDEDDARTFKLRKKSWGAGLGEIWDPGAIPIKLKEKRTSTTNPTSTSEPITTSGISHAAATSNLQGTAKPEWTSRAWNKPGEATVVTSSTASLASSQDSDPEMKPACEKNVEVLGSLSTSPTAVKSEDLPTKLEESTIKAEGSSEDTAALGVTTTTTSMFKKRKAPPGTAGSRQKR